MFFCADLSSVLSKDSDTHSEMDLLLSTLGASEPHLASDETSSGTQIVETIQPCSGTSRTTPLPSAVGSAGRQIIDTESGLPSIQTSSLPSTLSSGGRQTVDTESGFPSVSEHSIVVSNSDHTPVSAGRNSLVSGSSAVSPGNLHGNVEPLTTSQSELDSSIAMANALSMPTPLDTDESTVTRVVPSAAAYTVDTQQQVAVDSISLTSSEFHGFYLSRLRTRNKTEEMLM